MKDIVIIPAFNRPEYLYFTLLLIREEPLHAEMKYLFALDYGYSKKCLEVIDEMMKGLDYEIVYHNGTRFGAMKQSYNLLETYRKATEQAKEFVFLIEDDIFIGKSFFKSHYQIHAKHPDLFCSIGSKLHNPQSSKPQTMVATTCQTSPDSIYQSWGVCFRKSVLKELVLIHANENYYKRHTQYMMSAFPTHWLKTTFTEQDGLIRRIADLSGRSIGYPDYPRCYHAGIWSYHRDGEKVSAWSFEKRLNFIQDVCFDAEKMKKYDIYEDVFVCDLNVEDDIIQ